MINLLIVVCLWPVALWGQSAQVGLSSVEQTSLLQQALTRYYNLEGELSLAPVEELKTVVGQVSQVEILEAPLQPMAQMSVRARLTDGKNEVARIAMAFKAQWHVGAYVNRKQLARGTAVSAEDFDLQTVDRLVVHGNLVSASSKLNDLELVQPISAGNVLTWGSVRNRPLVHKGAIVEVVAEEGAMKITSKAAALNDAGRGETVTLRNLTTNRQFQAEVINENTAKLHF